MVFIYLPLYGNKLSHVLTLFSSDAFQSFLLFVLFLFFLQALKVEEKRFSYLAELEILDPTICKASAMEVTFQPVKCPTQVQIHFKGARRYRSL